MTSLGLRLLACRAVLGALFISCVATSPAPARAPNILLILSDDQGYGDLACYGNQLAETPCLDKLASQSVLFHEFHAQPVCSPTRAELMTGKRFLETGVWGVHGGRDYLNLNLPTIADHLSEVGYDTAMLGKWHLGKTTAYLPYNRGFDESWSITDRLYKHTDPILDHNGQREEPQGWTADILTDLALGFAARERQAPFFLYVAYPEVHEPWNAPRQLVKKYLDKGLSESLSTVFALNEKLDSSVGRLLSGIDRLGFQNDTVVLFLGDNGPINATSNGLPKLTAGEMALRNPRQLRAMKGQLYENGTRAPGMIRWTGRLKPQSVHAAADVIDIVPTLLEIARVAPPQQDLLHGRSLLPLMHGKPKSNETRSVLYANHDAMWPGRTRLYSHLPSKSLIDPQATHLALRNGPYKLVQINGNKELFDLESDPQEKNNLIDSRAALSRRLDADLARAFQAVMQRPESYSMPVFPIGYHGETSSYAYACAASAISGGVQPGSHSMDVWSRPGDGITLRIRVDTPGKYRLSLDAEATGTARVETHIGEAAIASEIGDSLNLGVCSLLGSEDTVEVRIVDTLNASTPVLPTVYGIRFDRL